MQNPIISFVVPATPAWAPYVLRMLRSLALQTDLRFEVVLAADGGDDGQLAEVVAPSPTQGEWPFRVRLVESPRPHGEIPHRNHTRNAGIKAAVGRWLWIVDCDFVWHSCAVEHALEAVLESEASGEILALSPTLHVIDEDPVTYIPHTHAWAESGTEPAEVLVSKLRTGAQEWEGKAELYVEGPLKVDTTARIPEGFPLAPAAVFAALQGFNEEFTRWGGNKIELTFRLGCLEPWVTYRVLRSVACWHQPHPQDPNKPVADPHRISNQQLYRKLTGEVRQGAGWWREQKLAVKRLAQALRAASESADSKPEPVEEQAKVVVGLVTLADRRKGIARDLEMINDCLQGGPIRRLGKPDPEVVLYTIEDHHRFARTTCPGLEGLDWGSFCERVDTVVLSEILPVDALNRALALGTRVVYIPNADWAIHAKTTKAWVSTVRALCKRKSFTVWAKSQEWSAKLTSLKIPNIAVPWVTTDQVVATRPPPSPGPVRFLANLGMGGFKARRGLDIILAAWREMNATPSAATLTIKVGKPLAAAMPPGDPLPLLPLDGLTVIEDEDWTRGQIREAWLEHDVVLYPTRWDGFGLSLSEALAAGCPALVTDHWPMREQIKHEHDGLLLECHVEGTQGLASIAEVSPSALAGAMQRLVGDRDLLRRMTCPQPGAILAKQHAMRLFMRRHLLAEIEPSVVVLRASGDGPAGERAETLWAKALTDAGWAVSVILAPNEAPENADFCLIGKADPDAVAALRSRFAAGTPIICWHHDLTDWTPQRAAWQKRIAEACDLCLTSEKGDANRFGGALELLHPGTFLLERPAGPARSPERRMVFVGDCVGGNDARVAALHELRRGGLPLNVYAHERQRWPHDFHPEPGVTGVEAAMIYAGKLCPSVSRNSARPYYTSNRLFNVAGAGGLPLVRRFPGLDELYPRGVIAFDDPAEAAAKVKELSEGELRELQWEAVEETWRRHTWHDRILALSARVLPLRERKQTQALASVTGSPAPRFGHAWDERARADGRRGVAHCSWTDSRYASETEQWWKRIRRQLGRFLKEHDRPVLDFGCGVARWASRINREFHREVVGVDASPTMIKYARADYPDLDLRVVNPCERLPFADDHFGAIYTCTVLQHVPDEEIAFVASELRRVLRPGGVVFLLENCHAAKRRTSLSGHVVFRREVEYRALFQGVNEVESWMVEGEKHAIMAGRMK